MPNLDPYRMQYDPQGRPYFEQPGQPRRYVSPVSMGGKKPTDTTGLFRKGPQWNARTGEWETPVDWGNVLNVGTMAGLTAGAANAFLPALGAAGGVGPSAAAEIAGVDATIGGMGAGGWAAGTGAGIGAGGSMARNWMTDLLFAGIPQVANLFGANMATNASDRAAQLQADAYAKGLESVERMYQQDRTDFAPYLDAGGKSMAQMADMNANARPQPYTPVPIRDFGAGQFMSPAGRSSMASLTQPSPMRPPTSPQAPPVTVPPSTMGQPPSNVSTTNPVPIDQPVSTTMPVPGRMPIDPRLIGSGESGGVGMVWMQAPTGERKQVPLDQVANYESRGARRIG